MERDIKFRAWVSDGNTHPSYSMIEWFDGFFSDMSLVTGYGSEFPEQPDPDCILMQFSGLQDSRGTDIYEGDKVYLAGYGVYEVEFPFIELYDARSEGDLGEIVGCVYS